MSAADQVLEALEAQEVEAMETFLQEHRHLAGSVRVQLHVDPRDGRTLQCSCGAVRMIRVNVPTDRLEDAQVVVTDVR